MVNQMYWCQEVEEAFGQLAGGNKNAMKVRLALPCTQCLMQVAGPICC